MLFRSLRPLYRDLFQMSLRLVFRNRRRYRSVTVAVACGVTGLMIVANLGDSVEKEMGRHLTILGRSTIVDVEMVDDRGPHPGSFTMDDVKHLKSIPHVMEVAPHVSLGNLEASFYQEKMTIRVTGVHHTFWNTIMASVLEGHLTDASHDKNRAAVCVLGSNLVEDLFKGIEPVGKRILVGGMSCLVIGTLGGIQSLDTRRTAFIPLSTARHRLRGLHDIKAIRIRADHWTKIKGIAKEVGEILLKRHNLQTARSIRVYYYPERINKVQGTVNMIRNLAVLASAVTVLIGGAGIGLLMLSAIRDRRREIGLKMALGAQELHILTQFLFEAMIVTCRGGILGMLIGIVGCFGLQFALGIGVALQVLALTVAIGLAGAVVLGLAAGIYPAAVACGMDAVTSMREE